MSVRKREWVTSKGEKKTAWVVDYADQAGERHLKTFEKKKDAEAHHATVRVDVHRGIHTSTRMTVAEAGRKWLADAEDRLEPATVESYRQHLSDHLIPYVGALKLSQLTVPAVRELMDRLRKAGRSAAMVKRVVGDLGAILADAQERGHVAQNVVRSLARQGQAQNRGGHPGARGDRSHHRQPQRAVAAADPHCDLHRPAGV